MKRSPSKATKRRKRTRETSPRVATSAAFLLQMCETGTFFWYRNDGGATHHDVHRHIEAVAGSALTQKPGKRKAARAGRKRT